MAIVNNILLTIRNKSCIMYKNNIFKERVTMNKLRISAVFAILLAVLAINAFAFSGGTGTSDAPYEISTLADLEELAEQSQTDSFAGKYFLQTADIEATSVTIGSEDVPFAGVYDGYDYAISGLETSTGLFAFVNNAEIKNVVVKDAVVTVAKYSAGLVGKATGTTVITNCNVTAEVVDADTNAFLAYVGGVCANVGEEATVADCKANITAALTKAPYMFYFGGIAGENNGNVAACEANGTVSVVSNNYILAVGGIAGRNVGAVSGSKNVAAISGDITTGAARLYLGGIVGENNGNVERAENKGAISCAGYEEYPAYTGGVVGYNVNGTVTESKNTGAIDAGISYVGGVLGVNMASDGDAYVSDTLNSGAVTSTGSVAGGIAGGSIVMEGDENSSAIHSSLNTEAIENGDAAIGSATEGSDILNVVANGTSDYADTMTTEQLLTAEDIPALTSNAWLFPTKGFLPQLATVKNLAKTEVIALSLDEEANKVAFSVYNNGSAPTTAYAVVSCYNGAKLAGTPQIIKVNIEPGYSVFTADSVAGATSASVMLLDDTTKLSPIAAKSDF